MTRWTELRNSRRAAACIGSILGVGLLVGAANRLKAADAISGAEPLSRTSVQLPQAFGYLYVLDTRNGVGDGQVIAIDLGTGAIVRRFTVRNKPDFTVSPDGSRLYISSRSWNAASRAWDVFLETYDTRSGSRLTVTVDPDLPEPILSTYPSRMMISPGGDWIYVVKDRQTKEQPFDHYYLAAFDTAQNQFSSQTVDLGDCGEAKLFQPSQKRLVIVACSNSQTVREIAFDSPGKPVSKDLPLPFASRLTETRLGAGLVTPEADRIQFITRGGQGVTLQRATGTATKGVLGAAPGHWVKLQAALMPPGGGSVYFATAPSRAAAGGSPDFTRIVRADPESLAVQVRRNITSPFYSMTLGADGTTLYLVSPATATITAVKLPSLVEAGSLTSVGVSPIFGIAAPNP